MRLIIALLLLLPLKASDNLMGGRATSGDYLEIENVLANQIVGESVGEAKAALDESTTSSILADEDNRVPDEFKVSPYFSPYVRFWFSIYTRYTSDHMVLHDKENLGIVYGVLDFSHVSSSQVNRFAKASIVQSISNEKILEVRRVLGELAQGRTTSKIALSLLRVLQLSGFPPPTDLHKRKLYFQERAASIRTQTGQRNLIENGIKNMAPYAPYFNKLFKQFELPPQLLAIPFLESSFNNAAHSRVGALGIWQFMPLIGSYFMPKRTGVMDYRMNPLISSVAALHLLRENKAILRSWDLAVTAYNSGTKHLVKARRELNAKTLEHIFRRYDHPHLGFASKNFYAEFLALVHTLAYRNEIFPEEKSIPTLDTNRLYIGMAKCGIIPDKEDERFRDLNPHLRKVKTTYPRGTIVVGYGDHKKIAKLSLKQLESSRPNKWVGNFLKNQSCSTR